MIYTSHSTKILEKVFNPKKCRERERDREREFGEFIVYMQNVLMNKNCVGMSIYRCE